MERMEKNFVWLTAGNAVSGILTAVLFIYLARTLEASAFGYFSYAAALIFYLYNFIDLGLSTFGIREVAKDRQGVSEYVSNIVSLRLIVSAAIFVIFLILVLLIESSLVVKILLAESALMLFVFAMATEWAFQGMEMMSWVFLSLVFTSGMQLYLNYVFVKSPAHLLRIPLISFISFLPIIFVFLRRFRFRLRIRPSQLEKIKAYLSSSVVIWGISVCAQAYNGFDIVLLGLLRSPEEVGCYTIARRAVGGAAFMMFLLASSVLPRLSITYLNNDVESFDRATRKFLKISLLLVTVIFLPLIVFSGPIISMAIGSAYVSAVFPLKIMSVALILVLFNLPYSTGLVAAGLEKEVLKQAMASALVNIISNFILIPKYGMIGASISFFLAELLAFVWILAVYEKKISKVRQAKKIMNAK